MPLLCPTAARALTGPTETTLRTLLAEYELDSGEGLLVSLTALSGHLDAFSITCVPAIGYGDLEDGRVLSVNSVDSTQAVLNTIAQGETAEIEFKSSMLLDLRRYLEEPGNPLETYKLEAVTRTLIKSIAAFANTGGGTIYVGVEDNTNICGLELDFKLANPERGDFDGWDQCLRGQIESRIFDGRTAANYVKVRSVSHEGKMFAIIQVASRSALTFIKKAGGGAELYVRSGTRSIPIEYQDIEKHYSLTRQF